MTRYLYIKVFVVFLVGSLIACSGDETSPEQQINQLNGNAKLAAEAKDVNTLKDMVADDFKSGQYDKNSIIRLVALYLLGHKNVHLFPITRSLQIVDQDNANAVILVAMAGQPIDHADQLLDLHAEMLRFNVSYVRAEEEWKVVGVEWTQAKADDFF
ncbi:MAG: hypothetical protein QNI91_06085 [Arenicellales bacterium]|nr:hypothetical protein [Arenicellales bacterium]